MADRLIAQRLRRLPVAMVLDRQVPIAGGFRARLLGLAHLERDEVDVGLLIPGCSSVHTFGMRFALDVYFLDENGAALAVRRRVPPRRVAYCRGASAALETPAGQGGEFLSPQP